MVDLPDNDAYIDHLADLVTRAAHLSPSGDRVDVVKATVAVLREDEALRRALLEPT